MPAFLSRLTRLLTRSCVMWSRDQAPRLSAALAFFTMLSLSPLVIVATSVAGFFFQEQAAQAELIRQVELLTGPDGAEVVREALDNAQFSREKSIHSAWLAGGLLIFTSTAVFVQLQTSLNKVWGVNPRELERKVWLQMLLIRGRSLALVLAVGFLLIVSLLAETALSIVELIFASNWEISRELISLGSTGVSLAVVGILFFLIFRFLPDARVDTGACWVGGALTSVLLMSGKWGIGLYLGNSAVASAYGAAGSLVAFLLWVYFSMMMFFFGAEFTHVLSEHRLGHRSLDDK